MDTHQIVRNGFRRPGVDGEAIELEPGVAPTTPAVGLEVPSTYPIMIPELAPGSTGSWTQFPPKEHRHRVRDRRGDRGRMRQAPDGAMDLR
jgi:hypothetical protein